MSEGNSNHGGRSIMAGPQGSVQAAWAERAARVFEDNLGVRRALIIIRLLRMIPADEATAASLELLLSNLEGRGQPISASKSKSTRRSEK